MKEKKGGFRLLIEIMASNIKRIDQLEQEVAELKKSNQPLSQDAMDSIIEELKRRGIRLS